MVSIRKCYLIGGTLWSLVKNSCYLFLNTIEYDKKKKLILLFCIMNKAQNFMGFKMLEYMQTYEFKTPQYAI